MAAHGECTISRSANSLQRIRPITARFEPDIDCILLDKSGKDPHATACLLSPGATCVRADRETFASGVARGFVLGEYRTFQIAIADLAGATGYDFSAYVGSDPLRRAASSLEAPDDSEPLVIPLGALPDVVL